MNKHFDIVIVGGGTVALATALDATFRGFKVAVLEKGRVGRQTNYASLGLFQSGLNYLYKDLGQVRMNTTDCDLMKNIWCGNLKDQKILIPIFSDSKYPPWFWDGYLGAYDHIRRGKNFPRHELLNEEESSRAEPSLRPNLGAVLYDEWIANPLVIARRIAQFITSHGGAVYENSKVVGSTWNPSYGPWKTIGSVFMENNDDSGREGKFSLIKGDFFINAAGPWASQVLSVFSIPPFETRLTRGTSIIIKGRLTKNAIVIFDNRGKYITILPVGYNQTLIGPTNSDVTREITDDPDKLQPEESDIKDLLSTASKYLKRSVKREDIVEVKCGLRPQLNHRGVKPNDITHDFMIIDHQERDGRTNLLTVFGGKISNQIRMSKETMDLVCSRLGRGGSWGMPFARVTSNSIYQLRSSNHSGGYDREYGKNLALSFRDEVGKIAQIKKVKALLFITPFIALGAMRGTIRSLKTCFKKRRVGWTRNS
jgi:glycerol-3-phosphate dehydrogenase